jgi:hypothetical protein
MFDMSSPAKKLLQADVKKREHEDKTARQLQLMSESSRLWLRWSEAADDVEKESGSQ